MARECDGCTKCCDGSLSGNAHGHDFYPGKPCYFVILNKGCTIYEDRPKSPCKAFECLWKLNPEIPDYLKPNLSGVIAYAVNEAGEDHLLVHDVGDNYSLDHVEWYKEFAKKNNINISWRMQRIKMHGWQGTKKFINTLKNFYV